jgi:hypothetical protein
VDTDRAKGLTTPAHTGRWNAATLRDAYAHATELARAVARESGLSERYVEMAVRAFRFQVRDLADKMLSGVAA